MLISITSCLEEGSMYDQISVLKTPLQRVSYLNATTIDIKKAEEKAALVRQENNFLEYEYPINEDEAYVVSYRFNEEGCFEIGIDTYFNKEGDAQNVVDGIMHDMAAEYGEPSRELDFYRWQKEGILIELDIQNVERGMIALTIFRIKE